MLHLLDIPGRVNYWKTRGKLLANTGVDLREPLSPPTPGSGPTQSPGRALPQAHRRPSGSHGILIECGTVSDMRCMRATRRCCVDGDSLSLFASAVPVRALNCSLHRARLVCRDRVQVLEVGKWALKHGRHRLNPECDTGSRGDADGSTLADGRLQREVRLLTSVVCPLGSIDSHVLQDQMLAIEDGVVTYVTVDCVKGLLGMRKDLVVRTTVQVSPQEDNPKAIRASVAVKVGDVSLPTVLRWASKLVERSIRADVVAQSKRWLNLMAKQEGLPRDASGLFRGTIFSWLS